MPINNPLKSALQSEDYTYTPGGGAGVTTGSYTLPIDSTLVYVVGANWGGLATDYKARVQYLNGEWSPYQVIAVAGAGQIYTTLEFTATQSNPISVVGFTITDGAGDETAEILSIRAI